MLTAIAVAALGRRLRRGSRSGTLLLQFQVVLQGRPPLGSLTLNRRPLRSSRRSGSGTLLFRPPVQTLLVLLPLLRRRLRSRTPLLQLQVILKVRAPVEALLVWLRLLRCSGPRRKVRAVVLLASFLRNPHLRGLRRGAALARHRALLRRWTEVNSTMSPVETGAARLEPRYVVAIHIVNHVHVHAGDGAVIEKMTAVPVRAIVAAAWIAEAVVDTAIESDVRTPIAGMEQVVAVTECPIRRSPDGSNPRS